MVRTFLNTIDHIFTYEQAFESGVVQVGGKAFNVARCIQAGFQVPDGLILGVQTFLSYLKARKNSRFFVRQNFFCCIKKPAEKSLLVKNYALTHLYYSDKFARLRDPK